MPTSSDTINLDGEVDTTPSETHAEAVKRMITREDNLCEMVGYFGQYNSTSILIETHEARCRLEYDAKGALQCAKVNGRTVWARS